MTEFCRRGRVAGGSAQRGVQPSAARQIIKVMLSWQIQ
jgi:hypothetical protein